MLLTTCILHIIMCILVYQQNVCMSLQNGRGKPFENMIYENVWGYFLIHFYVMRSAAVSSLGTWATHKL